MAFQKYNIENDVIAQFDVWIWASTTTINLKTWEGTQFPTSNAIIKFVQYNTPADPTSWVTKQESVLITNKSWDTLTVIRWFDWDTPTTFDADDYIYLTNHKKVIEDIQDEVTRLESDKLNKWGLRTALANTWKMFFSNWSNAETELAMWANNTYLKSNWAGSAPSWWTPPLDIEWQTTTTNPASSWYVALFDWADNFKSTLANLVKWLPIWTTSQAWVVERATDAEALWGSDEIRYTNAKQLPVFPWTNVTYKTFWTISDAYDLTKSWTFKFESTYTSSNSWSTTISFVIEWVGIYSKLVWAGDTESIDLHFSWWEWDTITFTVTWTGLTSGSTTIKWNR